MKNKEARGMLCNMPNVDAFITKRMVTYVGKIARSDSDTLPKKFLAAWINSKKKAEPHNSIATTTLPIQ